MKKTNLKSLETVTHGNLINRQKYIENSSIFKKKNEGITLIALVITIVILIILVGVSINTLIGENGIITQAKQANLIVIESELKSKVQLIKLEYETNNALEENNLQLYDYLNQAKEKGEFDEVIDDGKGNITVIWQGCSTTITGGEVDLNRYTEPGIYDSDFNLIYSWETALSQGKLTVENGILSTYNVDIESPVIILGDNVTSIQDETFAQTDIMVLGISKNVTSIQSNICKDCSNLKFVAVSEENETYTSEKIQYGKRIG